MKQEKADAFLRYFTFLLTNHINFNYILLKLGNNLAFVGFGIFFIIYLYL